MAIVLKPNWKIYYADGSTFSSDEGSHEEAPGDGFICVVGYTPAGDRYILHGKNHYRWDDELGMWFGMDWHGVLDFVRWKCHFKDGRMVDGDRFRDLMNMAHRDPDFPQRKG